MGRFYHLIIGLVMCFSMFSFNSQTSFADTVDSAKAVAGHSVAITTTNPFLSLPRPSGDPRWSEAFSHWQRRESTDQVKAAIRIFETLAQEQPDRLEQHLWLLRAYYMMAVRCRGKEKRDWAKKAIEQADRALKLDPENGFAKYWRWNSIIQYREFTESDFREIKEFGAQYGHLRELPVPDDDPLWQRAMNHWDARYQYQEGIKAIAIFEDLEKKYPDLIEPKLWLLRSNYWMHYAEENSVDKARWCMIAVKWGKEALEMEPRNPGVHYLVAGALGQYGSHTSFLNYVRYAYEITQHLTVVMEEDPNFYYGGLSQYLALAIARGGSLTGRMIGVVGFEEDLIVRSTLFASEYEPRYLRNYYALGELYLAQGKRDEAKKMLKKVVNSDPAELWQMEPENRVVQDIAIKLLQKEFQE
jgi:tetratricopeptide (TPR) repeat protein